MPPDVQPNCWALLGVQHEQTSLILADLPWQMELKRKQSWRDNTTAKGQVATCADPSWQTKTLQSIAEHYSHYYQTKDSTCLPDPPKNGG